jgi:hypothetical protein
VLWLLCSSQGPSERGSAAGRAERDGSPAGRRSLKTQQHARSCWAMCPPPPRGRRCSRPLGLEAAGPAKSGRRSSRAAGGCSSSPGGAGRKRPARCRASSTPGAGCSAVLHVPPQWGLPRKEVIQPQLPLRLPCYDFTPVTGPTFDGSLPKGLGHRLRVLPTPVV